jgi:hypothetical protein
MVDTIVAFTAIAGMDAAYRELHARLGRNTVYLSIGAAMLGVALVAEQITAREFRLDKADQLAMMSKYAPPPASCRAFFLNHSQSDELPHGDYHLDAMMIGMELNIPTVNGYSGIEPHPAFGLAPRGSAYKYEILGWLRSHETVDGICELDFSTGRFRPVDVPAEYESARHAYQTELLVTFSALYEAAASFVADGNSMVDLYPQYLQEHGYLDPSIAYGTGTRYRWMNDRYWIGKQACGQRACVGIGVIGEYDDLKPIIERYGPLATRIYFPHPERLRGIPADWASGEARIVFTAEDLQP